MTTTSLKNSPRAPTIKNISPRIHHANYYWAANHQTYLIFSALLDTAARQPHPQSYQKINAALISLMETIIDPGTKSACDPHAYKNLLKSHLQNLSSNQLQQLAHILKISHFNYVGHEIIYEIVERNGKKREREKMIELLSTNQLFSLLNELTISSELISSPQLEKAFFPNWNSAIRTILFNAASIWKRQECSKDAEKILLKTAQDIAIQLELNIAPVQVEYCAFNYQHSSVLLNQSTLQCDIRLQQALVDQKNSTLTYLAPFERALRDVLELLLMKKIFGADALLQHADTLIGINRPGKQKIRIYGPDRYIIEDDKVLVLHFLKCRNGDSRLSFFKAEFERMKITEIPTPPQQEKRIKFN
jgi:hypothetical protein